MRTDQPKHFVEQCQAAAIYCEVKLAKKAFALALLGLWLGATNHCRLESIPGLEFLRCASDTEANSNCDGDGCDVVEKGFYKSEESKAVAVAPLFVEAVFLLSTAEQIVPPPLIANFSTFASPELPGTWQFSLRTALLPRASSLVS